MKESQNKNSVASDKKRKIRNDIILVAVIALIAAAGLLFFGLNKEVGAFAAVNINGEQTAIYPLYENTEVTITTGENNENINVLTILDGKAYVSEANCPDGICAETRAAQYVGETIVCLPHKVVIEIVAENTDSEIDVAI